MPKDIRTKAFVLRRTNYGEADRILNLLTENGHVAVLAKGVRREKSKMSGGIELFCFSEITYHEGKNNSLGILTSSKMLEYYDKIPINLDRLELASTVLKLVGRAAESSGGDAYFDLVKQTFSALNKNINKELIDVWFLLNFAQVSGEEVNLIRDISGLPLAPDMTYVWDIKEKTLRPQMGGFIGANEIKLMRFMLKNTLLTVSRLSDAINLLPAAYFVAKSINNL